MKKNASFQHEQNKQKIKNALNGRWQTALEISEKLGDSYKSVSKILWVLSTCGEVYETEFEWIDDRYRKRKRRAYRSKTFVTDGAVLLGVLLGIHPPPEGMVFTEFVVAELSNDAKNGIKTKVI